MAFWKRSMAEDAVDRYNHTWSVLLFLIMSLTTWLLPLSPTADKPNLPKYPVSCWCPAEFTHQYVTFTNQLCATELNAIIRGEKDLDLVSLYYMSEPHYPFDYEMTNVNVINGTNFQQDRATIEKNRSDINFLTSTTPLLLFIFAVCLKLPHVIWHLVSGCTTLNVDRTLHTAARGQLLSFQDRKQLNQELFQATEVSVRSSPRSASLAYLLFKVLVCIVVVAELAIVAFVALPRVVPDDQNEVPLASGPEKGTAAELSDTADSVSGGFGDMSFVCQFKIKQYSVVQTWTVQCLANEIREIGTEVLDANTIPRMQHDVWTAVLAYLLILLFVNVISTATWLSKLFLGLCHTGLDLPMDARLLLLMSRENAGPLVTQSLVQYSSWSSRQHLEREPLSSGNTEKL